MSPEEKCQLRRLRRQLKREGTGDRIKTYRSINNECAYLLLDRKGRPITALSLDTIEEFLFSG